MRVGMTKPQLTPRGYSVTVVALDGRTLVASCLPQRDRNAAVIEAWKLARWNIEEYRHP
jgi:hypothetical protein